MARDDPFAGLRLSEQASPKLDQRLFTAEAKPVVAAPKPQPAPTPSELPKASAPTPAKSAAILSPPPALLDLNDLPVYKASYLFTQEELETLDDLKLEFRREYDTKVTKNDLIRCALHMMVEDHKLKKDQSYASRKMKQRRATSNTQSHRKRSGE